MSVKVQLAEVMECTTREVASGINGVIPVHQGDDQFSAKRWPFSAKTI